MNRYILHILIVDDNSSSILFFQEFLTGFNHKIHCASNGLQALNIMNTTNIDLVFIDIEMPVMNGIEATEKIRKMNKDLPVIACTAYIDFVNPNKLFNDVIYKPSKLSDISNIIHKVIQSKMFCLQF